MAASGEGGVLHETRLPFRPIVTPRWGDVAIDIYGVGPMRQALGAIRGANVVAAELIKLLERNAAPPGMLHAGIDPETWSLAPRALNVVDMAELVRIGGEPYRPIRVGDQPPAAQQQLADFRADIAAIFGLDRLALAPNQPSPETATAIQQRRAEAARGLRPQLDALRLDVAVPLVEAMTAELSERGRLPPMPDDVAAALAELPDERREYGVVIVDPLARQMDLSRYANLTGFVQTVAAAAAVAPQLIDHLNPEALLKAGLAALDLDPAIVRPAAEVAELRAARAEQQRQEAQLAGLATAGQAAERFANAGAALAGAA
jgi:hypothetical protein